MAATFTPFAPASSPVLAGDNAKVAAGMRKDPVNDVPPIAIAMLGRVMRSGADKYGSFNYREGGVDVRTYYNAAMRHLLALWDGQWLDEDVIDASGNLVAKGSGLPHAAHVMACMAILLDGESLNILDDNRPKVRGALGGGGAA